MKQNIGAARSKFTADTQRTRYGVALDSRQADMENIEVKVNCSHNHNSDPSSLMAVILWTLT